MSQNPRTMLPSQEMAYLEASILEKLKSEPFWGHSAEPRYEAHNAIDEFKNHSSHDRILEAYSRALEKFNRNWPLGWESGKGAFRDIDGKRIYCRDS